MASIVTTCQLLKFFWMARWQRPQPWRVETSVSFSFSRISGRIYLCRNLRSERVVPRRVRAVDRNVSPHSGSPRVMGYSCSLKSSVFRVILVILSAAGWTASPLQPALQFEGAAGFIYGPFAVRGRLVAAACDGGTVLVWARLTLFGFCAVVPHASTGCRHRKAEV